MMENVPRVQCKYVSHTCDLLLVLLVRSGVLTKTFVVASFVVIFLFLFFVMWIPNVCVQSKSKVLVTYFFQY